jgi:gamma-glutamyltranspeptidase/glutathione hydrolase
MATALIVSPALARTAAHAPAHGPDRTAAKSALRGHAMVVAAEPDAAEAGLKVLRAGGTAADAAVAIQAVLGLEEPQSSGLGGGAFMVYFDAKTGRTTVYNGREKAPATAGPKLFYGPDGKPMSYFDAIQSGRSTGAPGAVAMLAKAHADHGKRPWASLFEDAEHLARDGFKVPTRMSRAMVSPAPQAKGADATAYFTKPDGTRYQPGEVMKNPAYADTVRLLAQKGPEVYYRGEIADSIAARVAEGPVPGALTKEDIAAYQPQVLTPLCRPYRQYKVCTNPPPGGGVGLLTLLNLLEHTDIAKRGPKDPQAWYIFAQASRLAYADRDYFEGDPDFVTTPVAGLTDPAYGASRAALIDSFTEAAPAHGAPVGAPKPAPDNTKEPGGTTHFVVVDAAGNMVSMTTTVESIFGSGRMTRGFFLNNQLTDFSQPFNADGSLAANAPGPGKRPRSSMTPVIVFDKTGRPVMLIGSPGGNSIIAYVAKVLVGWVDWKMPLQEAVNLPNLVARGGYVSVEKGMDPVVVDYLKSKGLPVHPDQGEASGLNGVVLHPKRFETAVDPRREAEPRSY